MDFEHSERAQQVMAQVRGVSLAADESVSIMVNEEDHFRIQAIGAGLDLHGAWEAARRLEPLVGHGPADRAHVDAQLIGDLHHGQRFGLPLGWLPVAPREREYDQEEKRAPVAPQNQARRT